MDVLIRQIAKEYSEQLKKIYGDQLAEVILFGSFAKGNQHDESDVDFAVILKGKHVNTSEEIKKTARTSSRLSLKYGKMISTFPASLYRKMHSTQGIFREIRKYGIIV